MQNNNGWRSRGGLERWADVRLVRRQATYFANSTSPNQPLPLIAGVMDLQDPGDRSARPPMRVDDGASEGRSANQRELSPAGRSRRTRRPQERSFFLTQPRSSSPESIFACSGWCDLDDNPYPTVVSLYSVLSSTRVVISFLSEALSICLLGLAARMGGSKGVTHHGRVQLPE
jgi:hypothetical protein